MIETEDEIKRLTHKQRNMKMLNRIAITRALICVLVLAASATTCWGQANEVDDPAYADILTDARAMLHQRMEDAQ
jgi:hypothetical protein